MTGWQNSNYFLIIQVTRSVLHKTLAADRSNTQMLFGELLAAKVVAEYA